MFNQPGTAYTSLTLCPHVISGRGVPNRLAEGGCRAKIDEMLMPNASVAADMYCQEVGSTLTRLSMFGSDPITSVEDRASVEQYFREQWPDISVLFDEAVNYNGTPFKNALMCLINTTKRFA